MRRSRTISLIAIAALLVSLVGVWTASAQTTSGSSNSTFTVAAGQTATVNINVFCIDFGKDFPAGQPVEPGQVGDPKLVNALNYAISKGYDQSNARQVQLAMWFLRDGQYHTNAGESNTIAQEIVNNANGGTSGGASTTVSGTAASGTVSGTTGTGTPTTVQDAIKNNQAKFGITGLKNVQGDYFGTAVMQITNLTQNSLTLTLPVGSTFLAPGTNYQSLVGYATGSSGSAAGATAAATTGAATTAAATTGATVAATTAVATTTAAATTAATTTAATTDTATTAAATVTVAGATASNATTGVASAPATGFGGSSDNGSDNTVPLTILLLAVVVALATTGLLVLKRRNS